MKPFFASIKALAKRTGLVVAAWCAASLVGPSADETADCLAIVGASSAAAQEEGEPRSKKKLTKAQIRRRRARRRRRAKARREREAAEREAAAEAEAEGEDGPEKQESDDEESTARGRVDDVPLAAQSAERADSEEEAQGSRSTSSLRRSNHLEFDARLVRGENAEGAIVLFDRGRRVFAPLTESRSRFIGQTISETLGPERARRFAERSASAKASSKPTKTASREKVKESEEAEGEGQEDSENTDEGRDGEQ